MNLRNRFSLQEALSIFSAESKVKPSLSSLQRPFFGNGGRQTRPLLVLFSCIFSLFFVAAIHWGGILSRRRSPKGNPRHSAAAAPPSLHDYPEIYVANSPPFNHLQSYNVAVKERHPVQAGGTFVDGGNVPTQTEVVSPGGFGAFEEPVLRLIVLTMDRVASLRRLLKSLELAEYQGDRIDLDIWIDRRASNDEADGTMAAMVGAARECKWPYGVRSIHKRVQSAGLYEQWIYTWNVTEKSTETALILEDDLEVSRYFYKWLKKARRSYANDPAVGAFTLQRGELRPRQIRGVASGKLRMDETKHPVYKYRLLGTWGFAPEKHAWLEFRAWYKEMRLLEAKPYVANLMTTDWYKAQEKGKAVASTMWSAWWIKFADERGRFTVYANLPGSTTLASNYREGGMHYSDKPRKADFPVFNGPESDMRFPETPVYLDWDGRPISIDDGTVKFRRSPS